jgi:hypothetical protein
MLNAITNSPLPETLVCLILAYALLSILVSSLAEVINHYFNERGRQLHNVIFRLFDDGVNVNFGHMMYSHPMIANMRKNKRTLPQYISNPMFSQVLTDIISNYGREYKFDEKKNAIVLQAGVTDVFERFKDGVEKMEHTDLKLLLLNMISKSISMSAADQSKQLVHLDSQIQQWYGDQMKMATGWFKDLVSVRVFWVACVVTLALNVDSIHLFQSLYKNPQLRTQLYPVAEAVATRYASLAADTTLTGEERALKAWMSTSLPTIKNDSSLQMVQQTAREWYRLDSMLNKRDSARLQNLKSLNRQLDKMAGLGLPIGWNNDAPPLNLLSAPLSNKTAPAGISAEEGFTSGRLLLYILGLIISIVSISLGAPFWFDLLVKFINIRRTGKKPEE